MTHEYVIAVNGRIPGADEGGPVPTAIAWAADRILAVGSDDAVWAISRGDSTFIDLDGAILTPAPADPAAADAAVRAAAAAGAPFDLLGTLVSAGVLEPGATLEAGAPADLAIWRRGGPGHADDPLERLRIAALVREGAFTEGDEHRGPFALSRRPAPSG